MLPHSSSVLNPAARPKANSYPNKHNPMKTSIRNPFLVSALIAALNLLPVGRLTAQSFTTLHSFSGGDAPTRLILSGKILYGTTTGTVFTVNTDGSGFTN